MGTSAARKAPVGTFWRTAKTYASRFASGKEASPPQVNEVVARYVTALQKSHGQGGSGGIGCIMPEVAHTAACLGNFYNDWKRHGWKTALDRLGLNQAASQGRQELIPDLLDRLAGPGASLGQAVARAALIDLLGTGFWGSANFPQNEVPIGVECPDGMAGVRTFLGLALARKFLSDLGEPLEFQAATINLGVARQEEVKSYIMAQVHDLATTVTVEDSFSPDEAAAWLREITTQLGGGHER